MNIYQKVIACVIRFAAVALAIYAFCVTLVSLLMAGRLGVLSLLATIPLIVLGAVLFYAAIPLAKFITIGIKDD